MKTRFAPSPTGDLHLGGVWTALASHALGGTRCLRVEDIDAPRVVDGSADRIREDLAWLGLAYDETVYQSERFGRYEAAVASLDTYPCDCSRADVIRAASAPHAGEELIYPGTCREQSPERVMKRPPAIRLRVSPKTTIRFNDAIRGTTEQRVDIEVGDFALRRGDGVFAYQLAVAVDDAGSAITHVVRADDLLGSTARQLLIMRELGVQAPAYAHVPLVLDDEGMRLAKRTQASTVRELREGGVRAAEIVAVLGEALGVNRPIGEWRKQPWRVPAAWCHPRSAK